MYSDDDVKIPDASAPLGVRDEEANEARVEIFSFTFSLLL